MTAYLISKQLGSYCGNQSSRPAFNTVHAHEYRRTLRRHGGLLGMLPQDEGFCIDRSLFQQARAQDKVSEKEYTELLAPKLGCIKSDNSS
jgi:hypothetical protein